MKKTAWYLTICILVLVTFFGMASLDVAATETIRTGTMGKNNGIQWSYDESSKTLTMTGEDSLASLGYYDKGHIYNISSEVQKVILKNVKLSGSAYKLFGYLENLETIEMQGFDTSEITDMCCMFYRCERLKDLDVSGFNTTKVTDMCCMFDGCSSLTSLDLSGFKTENVVRMNCMFQSCEALESLDLSNFNTSKVNTMGSMFAYCKNLKSLNVSKFNTSNVTYMGSMFTQCESLTVLNVSAFDTSKVTDMHSMFDFCKSLESLDLSKFDTAKVTNMYSMFGNCRKLTTLDLSNFDTSNVENISSMFVSCVALEKLNISSFKTENVTKMSGLFNGCAKLKNIDISHFKTSKVKDMSGMFWGCKELTSIDVSNLDTSSVTDMSYMFAGCKTLESLDLSKLDTSKVTNMRSMFSNYGGTELNLSGLNTANVTKMDYMFQECAALTTLDLSSFNTSNVKEMDYMFYKCTALENLNVSGFKTGNVTDMTYMFYNCGALKELDVSGFDTSNVTDMSRMFYNCSTLKELDVSGFDTSNVTDMSSMFGSCDGLKRLDVSRFRTTNVKKFYAMFYSLELERLDLSGFDLSNASDSKNMLNGLDAKYIHTPKCMTDTQTIELYYDYVDEQGNEIDTITKAYCNKLLIKRGLQTQSLEIVVDNSQVVEGKQLTLLLKVDGVLQDANANKDYNWTVANSKIATVSQTGVVTGASVGKTLVTVTARDGSGVNAQIEITVKQGDKVTFDVNEIKNLLVGKEVQLQAFVNGVKADASKMTWSSSNPVVATCINGVVKACGVGTTTISCTGEGGSTATCTVNVIEKVTITTQPSDKYVDEVEDVTLKVVARGDGLTYCWQERSGSSYTWKDVDYEGADTDTLIIPEDKIRYNYWYRCIIKDEYGNKVTSKSVTLWVTEGVEIRKHPVSESVTEGENAVFQVEALGFDLHYQWQFKKAGTDYWTNSTMKGATTDSITVQATAAREGYQYRCVVTNREGEKAVTDAATLTVIRNVYVISHPESCKVTEGANATFKVTAKGNALTYRWQFKSAGSDYWSDSTMSGSNTNSITVKATNARNGYQYRCIVKDGKGNKVTSKSAKLTVTVAEDLKIVTQPVGINVSEGANAIFKVEAKGSDLTYQWQFKSAANNYWSNSTMAGSNTNSITVKATTARNGYQYRCVVKDGSGNKVTSNAAKLTVVLGVQITSQLADKTVSEGTNATFKIEAKGTNVTYQWQFKSATSTFWSDSTMTGSKTNSITVKGTTARNGYQYRCVVKDGNGNKVTSNAAKLTVVESVKITSQPADKTVAANANATFKIEAKGSNLTYQWQFKSTANNYWADSTMAGATTNSITVKGTTARNGYQYRCVVKDGSGNKVASNAAKLTVK